MNWGYSVNCGVYSTNCVKIKKAINFNIAKTSLKNQKVWLLPLKRVYKNRRLTKRTHVNKETAILIYYICVKKTLI